VFLTTQTAAAAGCCTWMLADVLLPSAHSGGKPSALGACCGIVAGLVCITPAALFVSPAGAAAMAAAGALACRAACAALRRTAAAGPSSPASTGYVSSAGRSGFSVQFIPMR